MVTPLRGCVWIWYGSMGEGGGVSENWLKSEHVHVHGCGKYMPAGRELSLLYVQIHSVYMYINFSEAELRIHDNEVCGGGGEE